MLCQFTYRCFLPSSLFLMAMAVIFHLDTFHIVRWTNSSLAHVDVKIYNASVSVNTTSKVWAKESDTEQKMGSTTVAPPLPEDLLLPDIHRHESSWPFISGYVWQDLVDHNSTFLIRPPTATDDIDNLLEWLHRLLWPVILILQNPGDYPWPLMPNITDATTSVDSYANILDHANIRRIYVQNPSIIHPKLYPLPLGLKWNYKMQKKELSFYGSIAKSGEDVKELFLAKANNHKIYVRPTTKRSTKLYPTDNMALTVPRDRICYLLSASAPNSTSNCKGADAPSSILSKEDYFQKLLEHAFVTSPAGRGLDCFASWETLLTGGIPIVPRSTLEPMFRDLPVWMVDDWGKEVNDTAVKDKAMEFLDKVESFNWDKLFARGWFDEMNNAAN